MQPERDAAPAATPPGDTTTANVVQHAVEQFIELHGAGQAPDLAGFVQRFPAEQRARILTQCREFLAFDGLLGHQEWAPAPPGGSHDGRSFGDFTIHEELGRGGMGVVYLATQRSLQRRVALKVMASGLTLSKRHVERFRREAAAAAQLRHPAIVAVHALTEVDGTFALAMDYVAGRNLADILDDLRLANGDAQNSIEGSLGLAKEKGYVAECAMFVAQLASALAVAHQANVVHRDLKPRNLMLDDRRQVRLLDFGLAKSLGEGSISMSGEITGTAHYMSPEQTLAKRVAVDHRADIWALGVILYEMLTLRRPFDGKNLQQIVYEICFQEPVPLQRRNPKVPRDLVTVCQKALEKDPNKRYQTAAEFEADLLRFLRWEPIHARPAGTMTRLAKWVRRHRTETLLAGGLATAGLITLAVGWYAGQQADALLTRAAVADAEGRFETAYALARDALALRNDATTRDRLVYYGEKGRRIAAEAVGKALRSNQLIAKDRELATLVALAAEAQHSSSATRSAVLDALGSSLPQALQRDGKRNQLVGIDVSPDGTLAVTRGHGEATVWDLATRTARYGLRGHGEQLPIDGAVFVGTDGLVTIGADTMQRWRLQDGARGPTVSLPGIVGDVKVAAAAPRVLLTYRGALVQAFDVERMAPCSPPVGHDVHVVASALSPCGRFAATSCGDDGGVRLWRVADGQSVRATPAIPRGRVRALAFAPDSAMLAAAVDHGVDLLRVADGEVVGRVQHSDAVVALDFDHSGTRLLSGSRDRTARLWRLDAGAVDTAFATEVATLTGHVGPVNHVAFDQSGQLALTATGGRAGELFVFDVGTGQATGTAVHTTQVGPSIKAAEFTPDGRAVLALAGTDRALVWAFGSTRGVVTMRQSAWAWASAFDPSGMRLVTAGDDERLRLWSAHDGSLLWATEKLGNPINAVDIDDSGERVASSTSDGIVRLHRLADQYELARLVGHDDRVSTVRFQAGGRQLLTAGRHQKNRGLAIVWQVDTQSRRCAVARPVPIVAAALSPAGDLLATVDDQSPTVQLWTVPEGAARGSITAHDAAITSVCFGPDGQSLLTASRDRTASIHDLDGKPQRTFRSDRRLKFAVWSHDGRLVLTGSDGDNPVAQLWSIADGSEQLRFTDHRGTLTHGAFSPDGAWVATAALDGTTCVWPTDPVAIARRLPLRTPTDSERGEYGLPTPPSPPK